MTTPDLSPDEREALYLVAETLGFHLVESYGSQDLVDMTVGVTLAALTAVPRLREVGGMGLTDGEGWAVRDADGFLSWVNADKEVAIERAANLNAKTAPGHHAVRLAVVEVATPDTEEKDDG